MFETAQYWKLSKSAFSFCIFVFAFLYISLSFLLAKYLFHADFEATHKFTILEGQCPLNCEVLSCVKHQSIYVIDREPCTCYRVDSDGTKNLFCYPFDTVDESSSYLLIPFLLSAFNLMLGGPIVFALASFTVADQYKSAPPPPAILAKPKQPTVLQIKVL
jgi:hypothetical protein